MVEARINLQPLFAVPFAEVQLADVATLNEQLASLFLDREAAGDEYRSRRHADTQRGDLYESRLNLFSWPDEPVRSLAALCHDALAQVVSNLNRYDETQMRRLRFDYHSWFHITRAGGYQGVHNHPNASWSGIYCVDPGDEVAGRPDSGMVRFHDPRVAATMYLDPGNRNLVAPYLTGCINVRHEPGRLYLFPSYVTHEIFAYVGTRPRIVVAFNCWVSDPDKTA